ncbi:MAG: SRPBCC family protein [Calditrichaeota bacterium]|nr:SRPBCC family protein [Calditrichota bacterium]
MPKETVTTEIEAPMEQVWIYLTVPKEVEFWAPNVRELRIEPSGSFAKDSTRHFKIDLNGKDVTLETQITHYIPNELFAETVIGGSAGIHEKTAHTRLVFRLISLAEKRCAVNFTVDYEMKGFLNKMLEKVMMGGVIAQYKLWFERLKTYAETGRPV